MTEPISLTISYKNITYTHHTTYLCNALPVRLLRQIKQKIQCFWWFSNNKRTNVQRSIILFTYPAGYFPDFMMPVRLQCRICYDVPFCSLCGCRLLFKLAHDFIDSNCIHLYIIPYTCDVHRVQPLWVRAERTGLKSNAVIHHLPLITFSSPPPHALDRIA